MFTGLCRKEGKLSCITGEAPRVSGQGHIVYIIKEDSGDFYVSMIENYPGPDNAPTRGGTLDTDRHRLSVLIERYRENKLPEYFREEQGRSDNNNARFMYAVIKDIEDNAAFISTAIDGILSILSILSILRDDDTRSYLARLTGTLR